MKNTYFNCPFRSAGRTDIGRKRETNQDRIYLDPEHGLFVVSDGMGGLRCGEKASDYVREAVPGLMDLFAQEITPELTPEEAAEELKVLIRTMSDTLFRAGNERENGHHRFDYGATLVGAWLYRDLAVYLCLGDSRGYLLKKDAKQLEQITLDMNVAGLMVRNGLMTRSEAARSSASSRLTAFVGMEAPATPESFLQPVFPGDMILLCSDGLHGVVPEKEIVSILRSGEDPDTICGSLIDAANRRGGKDNISAVLVVIDDPEEPQEDPETAEVICGVPEKISETKTVSQAAQTCREVPAATAEPVPENPQKG